MCHCDFYSLSELSLSVSEQCIFCEFLIFTSQSLYYPDPRMFAALTSQLWLFDDGLPSLTQRNIAPSEPMRGRGGKARVLTNQRPHPGPEPSLR